MQNPAVAARQRRGVQRNWRDPEYRARQSSAHSQAVSTPSYRALHSKLARERFKDPAYRQRHRDGIRRKWDDLAYRERCALARSKVPKRSSLQARLSSLLLDAGLYQSDELSSGSFIEEFVLGPWAFDFAVRANNHKILIECQGEYWHSLPAAAARDKAKATYVERYYPEFQLKQIWEHEFGSPERIKHLISYWLGLNESELRRFEFKQIKIDTLKADTIRPFLGLYHYLGNIGRSGHYVGAYLGDKLVAVASFALPVRKESAERLGLDYRSILELSRFCIHPNYQVKNFASWFLARAIKLVPGDIEMLIAFSDETYGHSGTIYKAAGWKHDGIIPKDYWYIDSDKFAYHKKTVYNRAVKMKMKEREYAESHGLRKVWGKQKHRYIKSLDRH